MQVNTLSASTTEFFPILNTTSQNFQLWRGDAGVIRLGSSYFGFTSSVMADMSSGDTCFVSIEINQAGGKVADIPAGVGINYFAGKLLE